LELGLEFNTPADRIYVISEAVFTTSHLTDTHKQNSTGKYKLNTTQNTAKQNYPDSVASYYTYDTIRYDRRV